MGAAQGWHADPGGQDAGGGAGAPWSGLGFGVWSNIVTFGVAVGIRASARAAPQGPQQRRKGGGDDDSGSSGSQDEDEWWAGKGEGGGGGGGRDSRSIAVLAARAARAGRSWKV